MRSQKTIRRIGWCTLVIGVFAVIWAACCVAPGYWNLPPAIKSVYLQYFDLPLFGVAAVAGITGTYLGVKATGRSKLSTVLFCALSAFVLFSPVIHAALIIEIWVKSRKKHV